MDEEKVEKPGQSWQMKLDFSQAASSGRDVLSFENLSVGYGDLKLIEDIRLTVRYGQHIAIVGPNGCGKSTLLRTIEGKLPPLAGKVRSGANVKSGTMAQEQDTLDPEKDALMTILSLAALSETDARTFLHKYLFSGDQVFTPISMLSYGERARLSLACLVASGCNLLLLDEPINHLDIPSRARFEEALSQFDGTVLAVAHDRFFIEAFAQQVWKIEDKHLTVKY